MRLLSNCTFAAAFLAAFFAAPAHADTEGPNEPRVSAGAPWGYCYARSIPTDAYAQSGRTEIFEVTSDEQDALLYSYSWYSQDIYLYCNWSADMGASIAMVRLGKWPRGQAASDSELALEFYYGGELVARYSTLDIAGSPGNVQVSASHYRVIDDVIGYVYGDTFRIRTVDGRELVFDARTGQLR